MKLLSAASTCFWCTLVLLWWYAIHPQWFKDCPGPILKPAPRPESWCVSYNKKLNKEVALADANKVSLPSSTPAYHSMDAFSRWQALQGALGVVCPSLESPGVTRSASQRKPSLQHPAVCLAFPGNHAARCHPGRRCTPPMVSLFHSQHCPHSPAGL